MRDRFTDLGAMPEVIPAANAVRPRDADTGPLHVPEAMRIIMVEMRTQPRPLAAVAGRGCSARGGSWRIAARRCAAWRGRRVSTVDYHGAVA